MIDLRDRAHSAHAVCEALELSPHPEGGYYRELWRDQPPSGERGSSTSILFLLAEGQRSRWHRINTIEIWLWQAGAPLPHGIASAEALATCGWDPTWPAANNCKERSPPTSGRRHAVSAPGASSAASSPQPLSSRVSRWRPTDGRPEMFDELQPARGPGPSRELWATSHTIQ